MTSDSENFKVVRLCNTIQYTKDPRKYSSHVYNKTCHRDRIARLTASCPSHKNFDVKTLHFANTDAAANANADAGGSTKALPGLRPGELKSVNFLQESFLPYFFS